MEQHNFKLDQSNAFGNLIVHLVTKRLDDETLKQWKEENTADFSPWEELHTFLKLMQRSLDDQQFISKPTASNRQTEPRLTKSKSSVTKNNGTSSDGSSQCPLCASQHRLHNCDIFSGLSENTVLVKGRTQAAIRSKFNDFEKFCEFHLIDNITGKLPTHSTPFGVFNIPQELRNQLADPDFNKTGKVDLLLDNAVFWDCLMSETLPITNGPMLRSTKFE